MARSWIGDSSVGSRCGVGRPAHSKIQQYYGGDSLSRVSWRKLAKVAVGCAIALAILLFLLFCWAIYGPDKHELTKHARSEWSREFRKIGLDEVPEHAKYGGGASIYGVHGHWSFRADIPRVRQWLSKSQSLRTAEVKTKPSKKAYLFYTPAVHRACLVMVFFAPIMNPPIRDREALVEVHTVDIGVKKSHSTSRTRAVKDALEDLARKRDSTTMWAEE